LTVFLRGSWRYDAKNVAELASPVALKLPGDAWRLGLSTTEQHIYHWYKRDSQRNSALCTSGYQPLG